MSGKEMKLGPYCFFNFLLMLFLCLSNDSTVNDGDFLKYPRLHISPIKTVLVPKLYIVSISSHMFLYIHTGSLSLEMSFPPMWTKTISGRRSSNLLVKVLSTFSVVIPPFPIKWHPNITIWKTCQYANKTASK